MAHKKAINFRLISAFEGNESRLILITELVVSTKGNSVIGYSE